MSESTTIQPSSKDNRIVESTPTTNYGSETHISLYDQGIVWRSIIEFTNNLPTNAVVISATLGLYYYQYLQANPSSKNIAVYKLTRTDWNELQSCWNLYKSGSSWTTPGGDYVTSNPAGGLEPFGSYGWKSIDVAAIVQDAISNGNNFEFLIRFEVEDVSSAVDSIARFYSRNYGTASYRPKLTIEYELPGGGLGSLSNLVTAGII